MSQNRFQGQTGHGIQSKHYNESSWITDLNILGTAATGGTGPTASTFISGSIGLTGQNNPVSNVLQVYVKLVDETDPTKLPPIGSTAEIYVWVQPKGQTGYYWFDKLDVDKPTGRVFTLEELPQGKYRLGLGRSTKGSAVQVRWAASE